MKSKIKNKNKNLVSKAKKNFLPVFNRILVCLIVICGVYYIVCINDLSIKGFVLEDLKQKSDELQKQNEEIQLAVMNLESFDTINKKAEEMKMVKVEKINYITSGEVALK